MPDDPRYITIDRELYDGLVAIAKAVVHDTPLYTLSRQVGAPRGLHSRANVVEEFLLAHGLTDGNLATSTTFEPSAAIVDDWE